MTAIRTIEGDFVTGQGRYALVVGRFNSFVVESLVEGAVDALKRHGVKESDITIVRVPGAFEIPLMVKKVADLKQYDAIVTLGAVIRGGTPHFEYVAGECVKGVGAVSLEPQGQFRHHLRTELRNPRPLSVSKQPAPPCVKRVGWHPSQAGYRPAKRCLSHPQGSAGRRRNRLCRDATAFFRRADQCADSRLKSP